MSHDDGGPAAPGPTYRPVPDSPQPLGLLATQAERPVPDPPRTAGRPNGVLVVPAEFVAQGQVVKGLPGTITLLSDAGYADTEIIDWLFAEDQTLPGSPMRALRDGRSREVHRRAQASGF